MAEVQSTVCREHEGPGAVLCQAGADLSHPLCHRSHCHVSLASRTPHLLHVIMISCYKSASILGVWRLVHHPRSHYADATTNIRKGSCDNEGVVSHRPQPALTVFDCT